MERKCEKCGSSCGSERVKVEVKASPGSTTTIVVGGVEVVVSSCTEVPAKGATTTTGGLSLREAVDIATLLKHGIDLVKMFPGWWPF